MHTLVMLLFQKNLSIQIVIHDAMMSIVWKKYMMYVCVRYMLTKAYFIQFSAKKNQIIFLQTLFNNI